MEQSVICFQVAERRMRGDLESMVRETHVRGEPRANPACQQRAPNEVIALTVSQKNPNSPNKPLHMLEHPEQS